MERRSLFKVLSGGLMAALGAVIAAPVLGLLSSPLRRRVQSGGEEPLPVADLARLTDGVPTRATVIAEVVRDAWSRFEKVPLGAVWLIRRGETVSALSTTCPHAGCFVDWEPQKKAFGCPCHGSAFDLAGKCTGGPSPRAMDSLETEVKDGKVLVRFQRFRQAKSDKEPA
ncbi:MAG: ubiquinol-cytochrome c reductase iron-sulfur subunit [Myxococcales bacterium]|nr:ubiquinol-cytochrome c reductase iron-sulfur subunit [Myxococcales bacterium]